MFWWWRVGKLLCALPPPPPPFFRACYGNPSEYAVPPEPAPECVIQERDIPVSPGLSVALSHCQTGHMSEEDAEQSQKAKEKKAEGLGILFWRTSTVCAGQVKMEGPWSSLRICEWCRLVVNNTANRLRNYYCYCYCYYYYYYYYYYWKQQQQQQQQ